MFALAARASYADSARFLFAEKKPVLPPSRRPVRRAQKPRAWGARLISTEQSMMKKGPPAMPEALLLSAILL